MVNLKELHARVYQYLIKLRENDPSLRYTYRKGNEAGRLDDGYWFYGNDEYFAISFWAGMDWKHKIPNISFIITSQGEARLEITVTDSDRKQLFVEQFLRHPLQLSFDGRRYFKIYGFEDKASLELLQLFVEGFRGEISDKRKIDEIIKTRSAKFFRTADNPIDMIDPYEFRSRETKIRKYQQLQEEERIEEMERSQKPHRLKSFRVIGYQDIRNTSISDIPGNTRWIFLTGENGSGKTSILRVLATMLSYRPLNRTELKQNPDFTVEALFHKGKSGQLLYKRKLNEGSTKRLPVVSALAVFGPNRLINNKDSRYRKSLNNYLKKEAVCDALWKFEYRMIDIEDQFKAWSKEKRKGKDELERRKYYIRILLSRIVPGLYDVRFKEKDNSRTRYVMRKDEFSREEEKDWHQLPSGTRSVFALVSEMMVRLSHYQKEVLDPSELVGIVIIDEIDLHLHPNAQRKLVADLSEAFRNVQFVVATHSPIPLLGAPKESVYVKVTRTSDDGVCLERLFEIEENIENMLPNILYTSSVFGMHDLVSAANRSKQKVLTQESLQKATELIRLKNKFGVSDNPPSDQSRSDEKSE